MNYSEMDVGNMRVRIRALTQKLFEDAAANGRLEQMLRLADVADAIADNDMGLAAEKAAELDQA